MGLVTRGTEASNWNHGLANGTQALLNEAMGDAVKGFATGAVATAAFEGIRRAHAKLTKHSTDDNGSVDPGGDDPTHPPSQQPGGGGEGTRGPITQPGGPGGTGTGAPNTGTTTPLPGGPGTSGNGTVGQTPIPTPDPVSPVVTAPATPATGSTPGVRTPGVTTPTNSTNTVTGTNPGSVRTPMPVVNLPDGTRTPPAVDVVTPVVGDPGTTRLNPNLTSSTNTGTTVRTVTQPVTAQVTAAATLAWTDALAANASVPVLSTLLAVRAAGQQDLLTQTGRLPSEAQWQQLYDDAKKTGLKPRAQTPTSAREALAVLEDLRQQAAAKAQEPAQAAQPGVAPVAAQAPRPTLPKAAAPALAARESAVAAEIPDAQIPAQSEAVAKATKASKGDGDAQAAKVDGSTPAKRPGQAGAGRQRLEANQATTGAERSKARTSEVVAALDKIIASGKIDKLNATALMTGLATLADLSAKDPAAKTAYQTELRRIVENYLGQDLKKVTEFVVHAAPLHKDSVMNDVLVRGIIAKLSDGRRFDLGNALVAAKVELRDLPWQAIDGLDNVAGPNTKAKFVAATLEKKEFRKLITEDLGWVLDTLLDPQGRSSAGGQRVTTELLKLKQGDAALAAFATGVGERFTSLHAWSWLTRAGSATEAANLVKSFADKDPVMASALIVNATASVWGPFADEWAMAMGAGRDAQNKYDPVLAKLTPAARKALHSRLEAGLTRDPEAALATHLATLGLDK